MVGNLIKWDHAARELIYTLPHNTFTDAFFQFLSGIGSWGIVWFVIAFILFIWEEVKDRRKFYDLVSALIMSLIIVELFLKNIIRRVRPDILQNPLTDIFYLYDSYSFPSGHATIAFACAYILSIRHSRFAPFYYLLATLIAFSRIYLGRHYPSDVAVGILVGLLIGILSERLTSRFFSQSKARKR